MTQRDAKFSAGTKSFWRRGLRVLFVLAINLFVIAIALEIGARFLYPVARGGGFTWTDTRARLLTVFSLDDIARGDRSRTVGFAQSEVLHPYLGWVMDPAATILKNGVEQHPYSRLGFLGGDIRSGSPENEVVIAISGGSVAGEFWLEGSRDLRNLLFADPRFKGKHIRFENFALAGYKQPQALLTLAYLLVQGAHFDMWINLDGFNEIALPVSENLPAAVAPVYPRSWQVFARGSVSPTELQLRADRYAVNERREQLRRRVAESLFTRSAFAVACWDVVDRRYERRIAAFDAKYRDQEQFADTSAVVQGPIDDGPPSDADAVLHQSIDIWMNTSIEMTKLCEANGIVYFQFLQPNQYFADSKPFNDEEQRTALAKGGYQPAAEKGYPLLVEAAKQLREQGVPLTDLTMMFAGEPRTIYRDTCCHINELGSQLIAGRIAETILQSVQPNP